MKAGLFVVLAVVSLLGVGFLVWNRGARNAESAPEPALGNSHSSAASNESANLEKPAAETRTAKGEPVRQAATPSAPLEKPKPAKLAPPVASSINLPGTDLVGADLESSSTQEGYEKKYAQATEPERRQALESLQQQLNATSDGKLVVSLKSEIEWLDAHLSP